MYVYSWFIVLTESLLTVRLAVSEIKSVQSLMDRRTDGQTELSTTVIMKGTKVHNPRAILSLLKLILFLVHEFTQIICNIHDIVTKL